MTTKHTPGPWAMSGANTVHGPDCIVAFVGTADEEVRRFSGERQNADARLIAAAPDLLEALEDMINHCQGCNGRGRCYARVPGSFGSYAWNQPCQDCGDARAAIAKAKGETK